MYMVLYNLFIIWYHIYIWGPISFYRPKHWVFHSRLNWFGLSKTQNVENTGSRELPKRQSENWWKTETPRKVNSPWYPHGLFWRPLEYAGRYHQCLGVQSGCFLGLGYLLYLACCCWMICQHSKNAWSRKLSGRNTEGVPEVKNITLEM